MLISYKTQKIGMTIIYLFALNRRQIRPSLSLYFLGYMTEERKTKTIPSSPKQTSKQTKKTKPKTPAHTNKKTHNSLFGESFIRAPEY